MKKQSTTNCGSCIIVERRLRTILWHFVGEIRRQQLDAENLITEFGRGKVVWRACDLRSTGDRTGRVPDGNHCMAPPAGRRPPSHSCWHVLHRHVQLIRLPLYYRCGWIIAELYTWYYTIVLYNSMNCSLYYTTPSELWIISNDHYYGAIKGRLFALHKNPTWASGGERSHKAVKRIHSRSRARLGKHKIETGIAIPFNLKWLNRQIAITRLDQHSCQMRVFLPCERGSKICSFIEWEPRPLLH